MVRHSSGITAPCVKMRVKVNYGDRAINFVESAKNGKDNGVVTAKAARTE